MPDSRIHSRPVSSSLPLRRCAPANSGCSHASPGGRITVTPVRTGPRPTCSGPSPAISVRCPTRTPATSVIAFQRPGVPPPIATPWSRARISAQRKPCADRLRGALGGVVTATAYARRGPDGTTRPLICGGSAGTICGMHVDQGSALLHFSRNGAFGDGGSELLVLERGEGPYVFRQLRQALRRCALQPVLRADRLLLRRRDGGGGRRAAPAAGVQTRCGAPPIRRR